MKKRRLGYTTRHHLGVGFMQVGIWIAIIFSAVLSFLLGNFFNQPLHWYLFILLIFIGFFINTIILILRANDD
ncbi:hypothetical protein QUF56_03580 [Ureibacillus composti]|nr:hypothetical protein [Ureibacillus composti]